MYLCWYAAWQGQRNHAEPRAWVQRIQKVSQRSEKRCSGKKTAIQDKTWSCFQGGGVSWEHGKKRAADPYFGLITTVLSPRAASVPDAPTSFHSCFYDTCWAQEYSSVSDHCLPQQQLSAPDRTNGWGAIDSSQPVPLEHHLSVFESKPSRIEESTKHRVSSLNAPNCLHFSVRVSPLLSKWHQRNQRALLFSLIQQR